MKNRFQNLDQAKPSGSRKKSSWVKWNEVDWSKSDEVLARELSRHPLYVKAQRKALNPISADEYGIDWAAIDWSLSNDELLEQLQVPYVQIKKYRQKLAPQTLSNYLKPR
jgi:hypothetical protein